MLIIRSLLVLILALVAPPIGALTLEGQARVIDGDTLDIAGDRVRLFGIDAPERSQPCDRNGQVWACGEWARVVLAGQISGTPVNCDVQDHDHYGRAVAICHAAGADIGQIMVAAGAAQAYRRYSDRYVVAESAAAMAGRGIWAARMQTPESYRHPAAAEIAPTDCPIKGNIGTSGRIYHRPGQRDYAATRISAAKGEAFFCSEADAIAAGFRAARR